MSRNRLICSKCGAQICECYAKTSGRVWWRVKVCLDCGWIQKRRASSNKVPVYSEYANRSGESLEKGGTPLSAQGC